MFLKDPGSVLDWRVDWARTTGPGTSIAESGWSVEPVEPGGLAVGSAAVEGGVARARLSGGVAGHVYRVSNRVAFAGGEIDERSVVVRVEER